MRWVCEANGFICVVKTTPSHYPGLEVDILVSDFIAYAPTL
jgi:hypothetical protein